MKQEIINKIANYLHYCTVYEAPDNIDIAEDIYSKIEPMIEAEAQKFAGWVANQAINGRTYNKLWLDYKQSSKADWNMNLITPVDIKHDTP